ncbi:MAG: stage II sporulation protein P [Oscillospiraceae bacterium]|nr:stage II sporulation protein P [Oscillospiraceae bacterium]
MLALLLVLAGAVRMSGPLAAASATLLLPQGAAGAAESFLLSALQSDEEPPEEARSTASQEPTFTADNPPQTPATEESDAQAVADAESAVPAARRKPIEELQFASSLSADNYFTYGAGCIRNATEYANDEMLAAARGSLGFTVEMDSNKPQVLIMHTHTTESYDRFDAGFYDTDYPTRSTDPAVNILAVGKTLCDTLNANGVCAVQATEYHDYPAYDNSYSRSRETVRAWLEKYPTIKVVLDIHRDGMEREDGTRVKPTVVIDGKKAAQIMIISGADDGTMNMPSFRENLKLAVRLQDVYETRFPGLTRPVYLAYRFYNQDLTTGSLLIEIGSEANTLDEAKYTAELLGRGLAAYFRSTAG